MKRLLLIILFGIFSGSLYAKKKLSVAQKLAKIEGRWRCDDDDVYAQRIIVFENVDKSTIYNKMQEFVSQAYRDANEVLQVEDKEDGLLIGKGKTSFYINETFAYLGVKHTIWHLFKAEVKDNRARVTISINTVNWSREAATIGRMHISADYGDYPIVSCYPIGEDNSRQKRSGYVFYYAVKDIVDLLDECEDYLRKKQDFATDDDW